MFNKHKKSNSDDLYADSLYDDDIEETEGEKLDRKRKKKNRIIVLMVVIVLALSKVGKWYTDREEADRKVKQVEKENQSSIQDQTNQPGQDIGLNEEQDIADGGQADIPDTTDTTDISDNTTGSTVDNGTQSDDNEYDTDIIKEQNKGVDIVYNNHGNDIDNTLDIISNIVYRLKNTRYIRVTRRDKSVSEVDTESNVEKEYAGNKSVDFDYLYEYNFDIGKVKVYVSDLRRKEWTSATETAESNTYNIFNEIVFDYLEGSYEKGQVVVTKLNDKEINNVSCYVIRLLNKENNNNTTVYVDKTLYKIQKIERRNIDNRLIVSCKVGYSDNRSLLVEDDIKSKADDIGDLTVEDETEEEEEAERIYKESSQGNGGLGGIPDDAPEYTQDGLR